MSANTPSLAAALEALLFVSGDPLPVKKIEELLGIDTQALEGVVALLQERYADPGAGLMLIRHRDTLELATQPSQAKLIETFTKSFLQEDLSKAALEVLAIVAYRGPITRSTIEAIRGVNCSFTLRNLLLRGLIEREENPLDSREFVYLASGRLLEKLGLADQTGLPDFVTLSQDTRLHPTPDTLSADPSQ